MDLLFVLGFGLFFLGNFCVLCLFCWVGLFVLFCFFLVLLELFVVFSCFLKSIATAQDCMVWDFFSVYATHSYNLSQHPVSWLPFQPVG